MARRQQNHRQAKPKGNRSAPPPLRPLVREYKAPTQYGKPFILLEDSDKNTFEFHGGAWVAYAKTIAQCRLDCQVKALDQMVNRMKRYEVRTPVETGV